nr:protein sgt1 like a [Quercus suber]
MASSAARGKKALDDSRYNDAIADFTAALKEFPDSPDYLIQRSTAYLRAKDNAGSLADAEHAVLSAQKRAKRELIVEAQFRRGCALYSLERFGDAEFLFALVKKMKSDHKMCDMWVNKTKMALTRLPADDVKRTQTVKETPEAATQESTNEPSGKKDKTVDVGNVVSASSVAPQQTPVDKIKWDWYQNMENVYFTLSVKGAPKDKVQVNMQPRALNITFPLVSGADYDLTLDPLFAEINPSACVTRVLAMKIEVILVKATPGVKWSAIEGKVEFGSDAATDTPSTSDQADAVKRTVLDSSKPAGPPAYPTSSKSGPKNWDKITSDLRHADGKNQEGGAEADEDYEGGDPANHFFQKLFKGASPDVQRAMMKSYTESNGTALSTNWDEVSKGPVETSPPDGMEAKKWG